MQLRIEPSKVHGTFILHMAPGNVLQLLWGSVNHLANLINPCFVCAVFVVSVNGTGWKKPA